MKSLHLLQAEYWQSDISNVSACNIVKAKCSNMSHLVRAYALNRTSEIHERLALKVQSIQVMANANPLELQRPQLMLIEARYQAVLAGIFDAN